ncbi:hypothetical protein [Streptomyces sp. NPDC054863]
MKQEPPQDSVPDPTQDLMLEAGRTIRLLLGSELLPYDGPVARALDAALASALAAAGADKEDAGIREKAAWKVRAVLASHPATAAWTAQFVRHGPGSPGEVTRSHGPGGVGELVAAPRFACPEGDCVWYRRAASQLPPRCPTHQLRLRPAPRPPQ